VWLSFDFLGAAGGKSGARSGHPQAGRTIRVPVVSAGLCSPITSLGFGLFGHVTRPGFPFGSAARVGSCRRGQQPAACAGIAINITYGSSGRKGVLRRRRAS
jgi:hypothetical protein